MKFFAQSYDRWPGSRDSFLPIVKTIKPSGSQTK